MRKLLPAILIVAVGVLAACGGDDEETASTSSSTESTTTAAETTGADETAACTPVEELDVLAFGKHDDREFTADDYETNPPAGGDHDPEPLQGGTFYPDPQPLGESVHLLEHGAVIGWTNGLDPADQKAVEEEFNALFQEGYYQLAAVENPEMEVPFALSAWGALQTCESVDLEAIRPFVEAWYASPKSGESALACEGTARRLPPC